MFWRIFKKAPTRSGVDPGWWRDAEHAAEHPTAEAVAALRARMTVDSPDEGERQAEMIDGLGRLLELQAAVSLPVVDTQHRVIGADVCHLVVPATLVADVPVSGKIFLTSGRLVFAGARVQAWPWHRLRDVVRVERDLVAVVGGVEGVRLQCNAYGDALMARHVARRLAEHVARRADRPGAGPTG